MFDWFLNHLPSFTITNAAGEPYLRRFYLFKSKRLSVYVHEIKRTDEDRELHDHPWSFFSILLKGSYLEILPEGLHRFCPRWAMIFHRAEDAHRLVLDESKGSVWTLVFVGRKRREWGFHTEIGWVFWKDYLDLKFGEGNWIDEPEFQGVEKFMD